MAREGGEGQSLSLGMHMQVNGAMRRVGWPRTRVTFQALTLGHHFILTPAIGLFCGVLSGIVIIER